MADSPKKSKAKATGDAAPILKPSEFMRQLRPEYYSDSKGVDAYILDASMLEYHLDSITSRNQTNAFELFCRKLCERTICPNLRPQTGPEGGGDSKTDTETYPVSDELSSLYVGMANGGRERWGFAFSAKKTWKQKARDDVKGIIETGRKYDRIICVTARFARSKDRAELEQKLETDFGVPVTIHDRSWIVKEVIEANRKDLAFNYLGVGQEVKDQFRLGPSDYSRTQQLDDIEKQMGDPAYYEGMETQLVSDALVAAKLSRKIEKPRLETDGRFARAIRLADQHGTYRQQLETRYEQIWTAYWYFDDIAFFNANYDDFEKLALQTDHAINVHFLCNLHQLLVNCAVHSLLAPAEAHFKRRTDALKKALTEIAAQTDRPNNALEGRAALNVLNVNIAMLRDRRDELPAIWRDFSDLLAQARGMGEFNAERLIPLLEALGAVAGNEPAYNELIENLAAFVSERTSSGEGALILLKRAQQLDFDQHFDMIRLLGKAALGLSKKEYSEPLVQALHLLTLAYRSAELFWAARATCAFLAATLVVQGEEESKLPVEFVPTMKLWAMLALQLRHIPDFLFAVHMLNGALATLPLAEESKKKVQEDLQELDMMFGSLLLNVEEADLTRLEELPDILAALGLWSARSALMYVLGYEEELRKDGSIPTVETSASIAEFYSLYASQPVGTQYRGPVVLNDLGGHIRETKLLGMSIHVTCEGSTDAILVAEAILGTLEAFFATAVEHKVMPHTEAVSITVEMTDDGAKPVAVFSELDMRASVKWPKSLPVTDFARQEDVRDVLVGICGQVLAATCLAADMKELLETLFTTDSVQHRINMVAIAPNSHPRMATRSISRISDWKRAHKKSFPPLPTKPVITHVDLTERAKAKKQVGATEDRDVNSAQSHRAIGIHSVIDIHAWNAAGWKGTAYLKTAPDGPPFVALLFAHREAATKIFERWRERFGDNDASDEIALSFIRNLPKESPHYYLVHLSAKPDLRANGDRFVAVPTRSMTMTPNNSVNLDNFLRWHQASGYYYFLPAIFSGSGEPDILFDLAIRKQTFSVKDATDIGEHDVEMSALRIHKYAAA